MSYSRTMTANTGGPTRLEIKSGSVDFEVTLENRRDIHVTVETDAAPGSPEADAINEAWLEQTGRGYQLVVDAPTQVFNSGSFVQYGNNNRQINFFGSSQVGSMTFRNSIRVTVLAPANSSIDLSLGSGSVRIIGNACEITGRLSSGGLEFAVAERVDVSASSGSIKGRLVRGKAEVEVSSGDCRITEVLGDAEIDSSSGDVRIGTLGGNGRLKASSGNISLGELTNPASHVSLRSSSGDVTHPGGLNITARTSSGRVNGKSRTRW